MQKLGKCQVEGCTNMAKYGLYRTNPNGIKEWLYVCAHHEGIIGNENMRRAGGYYERKKLEVEDVTDSARESSENSCSNY